MSVANYRAQLFTNVNDSLHNALTMMKAGDKGYALFCLEEALVDAQGTDHRLLRAHIVQCIELVKAVP